MHRFIINTTKVPSTKSMIKITKKPKNIKKPKEYLKS